jgi:hypothetical protein
MTQERRIQARDHRTQAERRIDSARDPAGHRNAAAATVGGNRVAASGGRAIHRRSDAA